MKNTLHYDIILLYIKIILLMSKLFQIKIPDDQAVGVIRVATMLGLSPTTYIRASVLQKMRDDIEKLVTSNGFTVEEEARLVESIRESNQLLKTGQQMQASSGEELLDAILNSEDE